MESWQPPWLCVALQHPEALRSPQGVVQWGETPAFRGASKFDLTGVITLGRRAGGNPIHSDMPSASEYEWTVKRMNTDPGFFPLPLDTHPDLAWLLSFLSNSFLPDGYPSQ